MPSLLPAKHWEQFGSWLRQMRRAAELTQIQVAKKAGISENQVIRIEKGESGTRRETAVALAKAIGLDIGETLKMAGYSLPDDLTAAAHSELFYPMPPKNYEELLQALESIGIEVDWALIGKNLENYTEEDFQELLERIKFDTEFSVRRKVK